MDVGNILTRHMDRNIEDSNTVFNVAVPFIYIQTVAILFIALRKDDTFTKCNPIVARK